MDLLSDAASKGSKSDVIKYARDIVAAVKEIVLYATEQAKKYVICIIFTFFFPDVRIQL